MVRLEENKHYTEHKAIEALPAPNRVYIPLSQHLGKPAISLVKAGDTVLTAQKIASVDAHVSSPIHSSVSGKVVAIQDWPHPVLGRYKAIVIENDGLHRKQFNGQRPLEEVEKLSEEQIRSIVSEAGIVGMGGASFPTHIKLKPPKPIDSLIINGAECEPYLTADSRLMIEKTKEIIKGIELVVKCTGAKSVYIAIEENKPEAIKSFATIGDKRYAISVLKSRYPQGGEKQLIKNVLGREVPRGKLPFDAGVSVQNVGTCYAIYEAVYNNKPLYERVVTVTGNALANPKNLLVRIGTPIKELIEFCGPLKEEPQKIVVGGPMMGIAQFTTDAPVIKSTTGVILFNKKEVYHDEESPCIRCAACVRECPVSLMPTLINLSSRKELWDESRLYGAGDCIECGLCVYVCPSRIRLLQGIKRAKMELAK